MNVDNEFQEWLRQLALRGAAIDYSPEEQLTVWTITHGYCPGNGPEHGLLNVYSTEEAASQYVETIIDKVVEMYPKADIDRSIGCWEVYLSGKRVRWFHVTPRRVKT